MIPTPFNRKERYLLYLITGGDFSELPTPFSDEERYLYALCQRGGAGSGGGAVLTGLTINVSGTAVTGEATLSNGAKIPVTGACTTQDEDMEAATEEQIINAINGGHS